MCVRLVCHWVSVAGGVSKHNITTGGARAGGTPGHPRGRWRRRLLEPRVPACGTEAGGGGRGRFAPQPPRPSRCAPSPAAPSLAPARWQRPRARLWLPLGAGPAAAACPHRPRQPPLTAIPPQNFPFPPSHSPGLPCAARARGGGGGGGVCGGGEGGFAASWQAGRDPGGRGVAPCAASEGKSPPAAAPPPPAEVGALPARGSGSCAFNARCAAR